MAARGGPLRQGSNPCLTANLFDFVLEFSRFAVRPDCRCQTVATVGGLNYRPTVPTDDFHQEQLFRAIATAAQLSEELGHPPSLDEDELDEVINPLMPWDLPPDYPEDPNSPPDPLTLIHDNADPAARATIASLLFQKPYLRLLMAKQGQLQLRVAVDSQQRFFDECSPLRTYLDSLPVQAVEGDGALLWEIHAAGATGHFSRLTTACRELIVRGHGEKELSSVAHAVFVSLVGLVADLGPKSVISAWLAPETARLASLLQRRLEEWLKHNRQSFWQYLNEQDEWTWSRRSALLTELHAFRAGGAHDNIQEVHAAKLFRAARDILRALVRSA